MIPRQDGGGRARQHPTASSCSPGGSGPGIYSPRVPAPTGIAATERQPDSVTLGSGRPQAAADSRASRRRASRSSKVADVDRGAIGRADRPAPMPSCVSAFTLEIGREERGPFGPLPGTRDDSAGRYLAGEGILTAALRSPEPRQHEARETAKPPMEIHQHAREAGGYRLSKSRAPTARMAASVGTATRIARPHSVSRASAEVPLLRAMRLARPHGLVVAERHRGRAQRAASGRGEDGREMAQPRRRVARHRPPLQLVRRELLRHVLELGLGHLAAPTSQRPVCASEIRTSQLPPSRARRARATIAPNAIR